MLSAKTDRVHVKINQDSSVETAPPLLNAPSSHETLLMLTFPLRGLYLGRVLCVVVAQASYLIGTAVDAEQNNRPVFIVILSHI